MDKISRGKAWDGSERELQWIGEVEHCMAMAQKG